MTILLQKEVTTGAGVWETLKAYKTPNATVSEVVKVTDGENQTYRLIVAEDTSGTCTATITNDYDRTLKIDRDAEGHPVAVYKESGVSFVGDVALTGKVQMGSVAILSGAVAPTDYAEGPPVVPGTGSGFAGAGSLYVDTDGAVVYVNTGDAEEPAWTALAFDS